jgi:hypothetical protein
MLRARRFALVALMALLGGAALAGCQGTAPDVAVRIGDTQFTNTQVDDIVDQIDAEVLAAALKQPTPSPSPAVGLPADQFGSLRQRVVQYLVFNELAKRYAAEKGFPLPTSDYASAAPQVGLAPENPFVKLLTDYNAYRTLLMTKIAKPVPTEADLRDAYDRAKRASPDLPSYEEIKPQLPEVSGYLEGLGVRNELDAAAKRYGFDVNPRYEPLEIPVTVVSINASDGSDRQIQVTLVGIPFGGSASPAVRDLP